MTRSFRIVALATMALLCAVGMGTVGCGDTAIDGSHGLQTRSLENTATGSKSYDVSRPDGASARTYDVTMDVRESYDQSQGPDVARRSVGETLSWQQPPPGVVPLIKGDESRTDRDVSLTITQRAKDAERDAAIQFVSFNVDPARRPTDVLSEGPHAASLAALLQSPCLAGLGASQPWHPARPLRIGESWPLKGVVAAPSLDALRTRLATLGGQIHDDTFQGRARLERVEPIDGDTLLHLRLEALQDIGGSFTRDGHSIPFSIGVHYGATAAVRLSDGTAQAVDATITTKQVEQHPQRVAATVRSEIRVRSTPRAKRGGGKER